MSDHDFDFEPMPGIPAPLPAGEEILWQGSPDTGALARDAFKIHWITGYLLVLALWRAGLGFADGGLGLALAQLLPYLGLALAGWLVIWLMARAQARAAIYTITTARVILRIGAALQVTFTIPFTCIENAALTQDPKTAIGTIALQTKGDTRLSYAVLWPHARPWQFRHTQPAMRAIPQAARVARILADAAQASVNEPRISRKPQVMADPGMTVAAE